MTLRKLRDAVIVMGAFLALIWILQIFNSADGYGLDADFGILPQHLSRLPDIFTAPFLHANWQHIEGNSLPLFVLGVLAAYRSIVRFLLVSLIVTVTSGMAVWLFQSSSELTVGASGLIFGYFGYVVTRGFFDRSLVDIGVGVVAGVLYWTILSVAIPGTPGISWIGHLGGLVGGVLAAWLVRSRTPAGVDDPSAGLWLAGARRAGAWRPGAWSARGPGGTGPSGPSGPRGGANPGSDRSAGRRPPTAGRAGRKSVDDLLRELKEEGF